MNMCTPKEKQSQHTYDRASQHINITLFKKYVFTNEYLYSPIFVQWVEFWVRTCALSRWLWLGAVRTWVHIFLSNPFSHTLVIRWIRLSFRVQSHQTSSLDLWSICFVSSVCVAVGKTNLSRLIQTAKISARMTSYQISIEQQGCRWVHECKFHL